MAQPFAMSADSDWTNEEYAWLCKTEARRTVTRHPEALTLKTKNGDSEPDGTPNWQPMKVIL